MPFHTNSSSTTHSQFEIRFECPICLVPRLAMVYGLCQHRICTTCLYRPITTFGACGKDEPTVNYTIRDSLRVCPICGLSNAFPEFRPRIPDDNMEMQKHLGVLVCGVDGCREEMWQWDHERHIAERHHSPQSVAKSTGSVQTTPDTPRKPTRKRRLERERDPDSTARRESLRSYRR